jgi:hypothetical protein
MPDPCPDCGELTPCPGGRTEVDTPCWHDRVDPPIAPEFVAWPKIARLNRDIVVTEKIDGTNAAVICTEDGGVYAQSRSRIITPGKSTDNFGFAAWVEEHADELYAGLGVGHHFGEWYGVGIQRGYGLDHKRFALFNTARWGAGFGAGAPACCSVVPTLYVGPFEQEEIDEALQSLRHGGSWAVPGWKPAEGVVVYHTAARISFKVTLENDEKPKNSRER